MKRLHSLLLLGLVLVFLVGCGPGRTMDQPSVQSAEQPTTTASAVSHAQATSTLGAPGESTEPPAVEPTALLATSTSLRSPVPGETIPTKALTTQPTPTSEPQNANLGQAGLSPAADGVVQGWAVLAEKDDYSDVNMTDLPIDYIGITQMQQLLEDSDWQPSHVHELREFTRESLRRELNWLAENADEDDVVFLYVAAHGKYLRDVLVWDEFFATEWQLITSHRRVLLVDSCGAAEYAGVIVDDPAPYLSIAAVDRDEFGWSGLEEEGLPIIGGVFTHYFAAAFADPDADLDGDGWVSAQEAALVAEGQQRTYMHEVVFAVPEFVEMYHAGGSFPEEDPAFPDVIVSDTIGEPLYLALAAYR